MLADLYGQEVEVEYDGSMYTSSPLLNADELISEWQIFRRAVVKEKEVMMKSKQLSKPPAFQQFIHELQSSSAHDGLFNVQDDKISF